MKFIALISVSIFLALYFLSCTVSKTPVQGIAMQLIGVGFLMVYVYIGLKRMKDKGVI